MNAVRFVVEGQPHAWQRARIGSGHHVTAPADRAWRHRVLHAARQAARRAPEGMLEVAIVGVWPRPQARPDGVPPEAWARPGRLLRPAVPDADNVAKAVLDALQIGPLRDRRWLDDDARVVRLEVLKLYGAAGEPPRVEVEIIGWTAEAWALARGGA